MHLPSGLLKVMVFQSRVISYSWVEIIVNLLITQPWHLVTSQGKAEIKSKSNFAGGGVENEGIFQAQ